MLALSIETSCDDTAVAIVELDKKTQSIRVVANMLSSQTALHAAWGGVVPMLAAREHSRNIQPLLTAVFAEATLTPGDIDLVAVTAGPGLIPALVIGVQTAKTLAYRWHKPLLGIHHIEGHIYANFIGENTTQPDTFPLLALVVSGGHTQLIVMRDHFNYEILGETQDDAVGEAFDKVAKMLGLAYPGGPAVALRASKFQASNSNFQKSNSQSDLTLPPRQNDSVGLVSSTDGRGSITLPRPMINSGDYNFSFSGIKTAVLYALQKQTAETLADENFINAVCGEFQNAVVEVLVSKTKQAIEEYTPKTVVIAGGVSANVHLREQLAQMISHRFPDTTFLTPEFKYSLDNAAMIGSAALLRWQQLSDSDKEQAFTTWQTLEPNANLKLQIL